MATMSEGIRLSKTSPAFLHGNSTSHTWAFSAFAELIDNAYDPDCGGNSLSIDKRKIGATDCLIFLDNGNGLTTDKLHKMLSFGYCDKEDVGGHRPVGHYGNGFKSGSMRIGRDALVFTCERKTMSVGFLSQSYLAAICADSVLVPIVTWDKATKQLLDPEEMRPSLDVILRYSLFRNITDKELLKQFDDIISQPDTSRFKTGTKIILYALKRGSDDRLELDFESDPKDIINSGHHVIDEEKQVMDRPVREYTAAYHKSLREYCSILYLKPRMKIILRGKKVKTMLIAKSLKDREVDTYRPKWLDKPVQITLGFGENRNDYGVMLYHRNRLIKGYEKVGYQKTNKDVSVVGVAQVDFLQPVHNKQDFDKTDRYNSFMQALGYKMNDYYNEKTYGKSSAAPSSSAPMAKKWTWAQCDNCLQWRRLPIGTENELPEKWYCYLNPDSTHSRCDIPEEPEDEDDVLLNGRSATYTKTYKKTLEQEKMKEKESELHKQREQEMKLKLAEQEIENMKRTVSNPQAASGIVKDDSLIRRELAESRKREVEQRKVIAQLLTQKAEIQQQIKHTTPHSKAGRPLVLQVGNLIAKTSRTPTATATQPPPQPQPASLIKAPANNIQSAAPRAKVTSMRAPSPEPSTSTASTSNQQGDASDVSVKAEKNVSKRMKLEDGSFVLIKDNEKQSQQEVNVIDNGDEEMFEVDSPKSRCSSTDDIKPNKDELDAAMQEDTIIVKREHHSPKSRCSSTDDIKPNKDELDAAMQEDTIIVKREHQLCDMTNNSAQTDSVEIISSDLSNRDIAQLVPLEQLQFIIKQDKIIKETKEKLTILRRNISRLLSFILPDVDLGQANNIDNILIEVIKINSQNSS